MSRRWSAIIVTTEPGQPSSGYTRKRVGAGFPRKRCCGAVSAALSVEVPAALAPAIQSARTLATASTNGDSVSSMSRTIGLMRLRIPSF